MTCRENVFHANIVRLQNGEAGVTIRCGHSNVQNISELTEKGQGVGRYYKRVIDEQTTSLKKKQEARHVIK